MSNDQTHDSDWTSNEEGYFKFSPKFEAELLQILGSKNKSALAKLGIYVGRYRELTSHGKSAGTQVSTSRSLKPIITQLKRLDQSLAKLDGDARELFNYEHILKAVQGALAETEAQVKSRKGKKREELARHALAFYVGKWLREECEVKLSNYDPIDNKARKAQSKKGKFARVLRCIFQNLREDSSYIRSYLKTALKKIGE